MPCILFPCSSWKHVQSYSRETTEWIFQRSIIHGKGLFPWRESWKFHSIAKVSFFLLLGSCFVILSRHRRKRFSHERVNFVPKRRDLRRRLLASRPKVDAESLMLRVLYNVALKEKRLWKFAAIGPWQWIFTRVENIKRNPLIWKLLLRDNADKIALVALSVIAEKLDVVRIN